MKKKKLLIIGGSSFFSINFIKELFQDYEITGSYFSKKTLKINKIKINITNKKNILNNVKKFRPDIILNAAGLTDVEECERNYKKAFNLNALGSKYLSEICTKFKIKLIHISTDHLFDGKKSFYKELDKTKPVNNYGKTKLLGEKYVKKCKNSIIIRTNFFGPGHGFSFKFFDKIIKNLNEKKKLYLFDDIFYTPISLVRLINIINLLIKKKISGIYNISGNERISKYKFGVKLAKIMGFDQKLIIKDYFMNRTNLVFRPKDMSLNNNKVKKKLKIDLGDIKDNIFDYYSIYKKKR